MIDTDVLLQHYQKAQEHHPQALALLGADAHLSFAALHQRALQWVPLLEPLDSALLYLPPSCTFYSLVVAGLLTHTPLVLLDPAVPVPASIQTFSTAVLTSPELQAQALACFSNATVHISPPHAPLVPQVKLKSASTSPQALHHLMTSGSSGTHSFVTIGRDAVALHMQEMNLHYPYPAESVNANLTRHTSAAGINGFWRVLLSGAGFLFSDLKQEALSQVYQRLKAQPLHSLQGIGPLLEALMDVIPPGEKLDSLQHIIFGGQSLSPQQLQKIARVLPTDCAFSFNYSSSETLQITAYSDTLSGALSREQIPCGRPLPSREVKILGPDQKEMPPGESGEIVVFAEHMALAIESPTAAERFYVDPHQPSRQVYHTRDLGRWNTQGELEYLGRLDRQIKLNGVRIDPARIEKALESLPSIRHAVVLGLDHEGQTHLVSCFVSSASLSQATLHAQLSQILPDTWVPRFGFPFEALPLQASGKIDYPQLKKQAQALLSAALTPAPTPAQVTPDLENQLQQLWNQILGYTVQGEDPHFMLAGGDSLKANLLVSQLTQLGYGPLESLWVAQHPTLKAQVRALQHPTGDTSAISSATAQGPLPHDKEKILQYLGWV